MPGAPVLNNAIAEVIITGEADGQTTMTVLHFRVSGIPDPPGNVDSLVLDAQLYADLNAGMSILAAYRACMAAEALTKSVSVQWIYPTRLARDFVEVADNNGTGPSGLLPSLVAGAITKRGVFAGRHSIGAVHMPAVPSSWESGGSLTLTGIATYKALADLLPVPLTDILSPYVFTGVIFNRDDPNSSVEIATAGVQTTLRTARRRVVGRGI